MAHRAEAPRGVVTPASGGVRVTQGVTSAVAEPRLRVALAMRGDRLEALLRAYLAGPGRGVFVIDEPDVADAMIGDHDHASSRAEMLRFRERTGRPVIALAVREPTQRGAVWVPKPMRLEALAEAAQRIWPMRSPLPSPRPHTLRLLSLAADAPADVAGARRLPSAGPYRTAGRDDWTARIAWMACGALGIAVLVSALGWRPGGLSIVRALAPAPAAVSADIRALQHAVQVSLQSLAVAGPVPATSVAGLDARQADPATIGRRVAQPPWGPAQAPAGAAPPAWPRWPLDLRSAAWPAAEPAPEPLARRALAAAVARSLAGPPASGEL